MPLSKSWKQPLEPHAPGNETAQRVAAQFRADTSDLKPWEIHHGFSGAVIWRSSDHCLRAWPAHASLHQIQTIHNLQVMARRSGMSIIPQLYPTHQTQSYLQYQDHLWEMSQWMPGKADFLLSPSELKLTSACQSLAQLHLIWAQVTPSSMALCPAVQRRLAHLQLWQQVDHTLTAIDPLLKRAIVCLRQWMPKILDWLSPWIAQPVPIQYCLCDIHSDHLLYQGNELSGLIDFGEVKQSHIAVDLARMMGSLVGDEDAQWQIGLAAYREVRGLSPSEEAMARQLDRSGVLIGIWNWLRWLLVERRAFANLPTVYQRLEQLVDRAEGFSGCVA